MRLLTAFVVAMTIALPSVHLSAQMNVAGPWEITFETQQGPTTVNVQLQQEGEKLTGELSSPFGVVPITGTASETSITMIGSVELMGQKIDMHADAKLEEQKLVGVATFGTFGDFPFTAKRPEPREPAAAAAQAAPGSGDATGTWNLTLNFMGYQFPVTATLQQDGEKVTGTLNSIAGEMPVTGTMIGKSLKLDFQIQLPTGTLPVTITGDLGDEGFAGKASVAGLGEADWTGKRAN